MIWGVGTGRCGTAGLAVQLGGEHERQGSVAELAAGGHRAVVDPAFWRVIPSIYEADPAARFVVIYRDPVEVVESLLSVGIFRCEFDELNKVPYAWNVRPPVWPGTWEPYQKAAWLWRTINSRIMEMVLTNFEVRHVSELDTHLNKGVEGKLTFGVLQEKVRLTQDQRLWVLNYCGPTMDMLYYLKDATHGATGAWGKPIEVEHEVIVKDWREEGWDDS